MEGRRARVEERGQAKMDIKRVRVLVRGAEASQSYVTQPPISSGQLGTYWGDSHGCMHIQMQSPIPWPWWQFASNTLCWTAVQLSEPHTHTHTWAALPGSSLQALQLFMWCLQIWCCCDCTFNKHMRSGMLAEMIWSNVTSCNGIMICWKCTQSV